MKAASKWFQFARAVAFFAVALIILPLYRLSQRGKAPIWLICERADEARDNGYHFFRYCMSASVPKDIRYVINTRSADLRQVENLGTLVPWGSLNHYLAWLAAECLISAHAGHCAPDPWISWRLRKLGIARQLTINLKHGVTAINVPDFIVEGRWDALVTSASNEREFLVQSAGHSSEAVVLTGFPRFDALHEPGAIKDQILLMPTWRRWLNAPTDRCRNQRDDLVRESDWYKAFHGFLSDVRLHRALTDHDWRLVFYPHYGVQPFLHLFEGLPSCIMLASRYKFEVQELLKESKVLVTDFSSVSFDFAYMRKPVVYLLPDEDEYFGGHFNRGYFDFEEDGFGPVVRNPFSAVSKVAELIARGGMMSKDFCDRVDQFFEFHDSENSRRTLDAVLRVSNGGG